MTSEELLTLLREEIDKSSAAKVGIVCIPMEAALRLLPIVAKAGLHEHA